MEINNKYPLFKMNKPIQFFLLKLHLFHLNLLVVR